MFVTLREGEPPESLLKRFTRAVQNSGLLREVRQKRFFISEGEKERIAQRKSIARIRRAERKRLERELGLTRPRRRVRK